MGSLIKDEIEKNNRTLLQSMQTLLESSVQQLKRSSTESTENQLREIKKLKYSEPHRFKKKANEDQHKFNTKVIDSLAEVSEALEKNERQKHILLADKSEFGWATVNEYKKHELADNSEDEKRIIKSELRAKAQKKQIRSNISSRRSNISFGHESQKEELPSSPLRNSFTYCEPFTSVFIYLFASYK